MSAQPTVGRIVHYTNLGDRDGKYPPEIQAAVITKVLDAERGDVALHIFYATGQFDMPEVLHTPAPAGSEAARGKWGWPTIVYRREILGTRNSELAGDESTRDPPIADDVLKVRRAVSVIYDYRRRLGVKETEAELLEKLGDILEVKSDV